MKTFRREVLLQRLRDVRVLGNWTLGGRVLGLGLGGLGALIPTSGMINSTIPGPPGEDPKSGSLKGGSYKVPFSSYGRVPN